MALHEGLLARPRELALPDTAHKGQLHPDLVPSHTSKQLNVIKKTPYIPSCCPQVPTSCSVSDLKAGEQVPWKCQSTLGRLPYLVQTSQ